MTKGPFRSVAAKPQRMALADDLFACLEAGEKLCTIRAGKRDIAAGELTFFTTSRDGREVKVNVTEVRHKKLGELTDAEAQLDGADTAAQMAQAMKRFYPDIDAESVITIVLYDPPKTGRGRGLTGKTERSLLTIDCEGSGITGGAGFSIGIEYTDTERPWGTLGYAATGRISKDDEWRWNQVFAIVESIGDSVFDSVKGDDKAHELAQRLRALNASFHWQIGSFNGVPAVQVDAVDGRRLDIGFDKQGGAVTIGRSAFPVSSPKGINAHGAGGYGRHQKQRYHFHGTRELWPSAKKPAGPG